MKLRLIAEETHDGKPVVLTDVTLHLEYTPPLQVVANIMEFYSDAVHFEADLAMQDVALEPATYSVVLKSLIPQQTDTIIRMVNTVGNDLSDSMVIVNEVLRGKSVTILEGVSSDLAISTKEDFEAEGAVVELI